MGNHSTEKNKQAMLGALEKHLGVVTDAAEAIGIARSTHYSWMDEDPEYKDKVEKLEDRILDFGESQLFKRIKSGSVNATTFFLERKGKSRGYGKESTVNVRGSIDFNSEPKALETLLKTYALVASKQKE